MTRDEFNAAAKYRLKCDQSEMYHEMLGKISELYDMILSLKAKCALQNELINTQRKHIEFLSDYIENGGTKFYEDC